METRVTRLLGIEKPVLQGGMAWVSEGRLAAAVSNAGGLGIIACGAAEPEWVEEQVKLARSLTDKPIGCNVMMMSPYVAQIAPMLAELKVDVITTGAGSPSDYIPIWKEAGCKVAPVIPSAALAKRMERIGADAVIAEGCESGGHIGELTTMALIPAVCEAVSIPVIAAGGIADGRGLLAAFALGAEGVQMGTRFLASEECRVAQAYKDKVLAAKDSDTIVTGRAGGHPVRQLKNAFARKVKAAEGESGAAEELVLAGSLRRAVEGDVTGGSMMAGQIACLVKEQKTCKQIIDDLFEQVEAWSGLSLQQMADRNASRSWFCGEGGE